LGPREVATWFPVPDWGTNWRLVAWVGLGLTGKLPVMPSNQKGVLVEEVMAGQRRVGVAEPSGVLWGQGALGENSGAELGGQGAGVVLANSSDTAVDDVASSGGAWWR